MTQTNPCLVIDEFVRAINTQDETALTACFAPGAVVRDGGLEYRGTCVKQWIHDVFERYDLRLDVSDISGLEDAWTFTALVSGNFEGSPVRLEHNVTIADGRIELLEI